MNGNLFECARVFGEKCPQFLSKNWLGCLKSKKWNLAFAQNHWSYMYRSDFNRRVHMLWAYWLSWKKQFLVQFIYRLWGRKITIENNYQNPLLILKSAVIGFSGWGLFVERWRRSSYIVYFRFFLIFRGEIQLKNPNTHLLILCFNSKFTYCSHFIGRQQKDL